VLLTDSHSIAVIFAALTTYIVAVEQSGGSRKAVLLHKAQLCLLGLAEFRSHWGFVDWMYRMFSTVLDRLTGNDNKRPHSDRTQRPADASDQRATGALLGQDCNTTIEAVRSDELATENALPDNWLDPFLPLDNFEWFEQNSAWLGYLDPQMAMWPSMT
jgi:hypothetical protein